MRFRLSTKLRVLLVAMTVLLIGAPPSLADFAGGLEAYDAGDFESAFEAWKPLADSGDAEAQIALAGLYANGLGVPQSFQRAKEWYRLAAEQGDPVAQLNLGDFYARGLGGPPDLVLAFVWLDRAARQGRTWAARRRDEIAATITPAQLEAAQQQLLDSQD